MTTLTYLATRCHGLITHLLTDEILNALITVKDSQDIVDILNPTDYGKYIREQDKIEVTSLEEIFNKVLIDRYNFVLKASSDDIREFLMNYYRKFEVQNIIRILRGKILKIPTHPFENILYPISNSSKINFEAISEAENIEEVITELGSTPYRRVKNYIDWYNKYGSTLPLEFSLKRIYYDNLFKSLNKIPSRHRKNVERLIRIEVDITNCFTSTAASVFDYEEELIESMLIPYSLRIPLQTLGNAIHTESAHEILTYLGPYYEIVKNLLAKEETLAQTEASRLLRKELIYQKTLESMKLTFVLCYLYLCEFEFRDLTFITLAIKHNIKPDEYLIYKK